MSAREQMLAAVRAALPTRASVDAAGRAPAADYVHARELPDPLGLFADRVEDYRATVIRTSAAGVAAAVAQSLDGARAVVVPPGLDTAWLPDGLATVSDEPPLSSAELDAVDAVITGAAVAIAVTGTIVLDHTEGQGRRALTLVPDRHVCVVTAEQVVGDVPEAVTRLRATVDNGRPLTWISGPSATSDIELDRVEGVHGPRILRVVLVEPTDDAG